MKVRIGWWGVLEWIVASALVVACVKFSVFSYGSRTPVEAHEKSERTYHYGPSDILDEIDVNGITIYLCRYKDWFSASTVKKGLFLWYPGDQVSGSPIDYSKKISYSWGSSSNYWGNLSIMKVYGYVNDPAVYSIELELVGDEDVKTMRYELDDSRLFIFYWNRNRYNYKFRYLRGYDRVDTLIYEEKMY